MRLGIITHHYINNFGAFLQLHALIHILKSLFPHCQVEVINFQILGHYLQNRRNLIIRRIRVNHLHEDIHRWINEAKLSLLFTKCRRQISISQKVLTPDDINSLDYDAIIIGSDEVWSITDSAYHPVKFGYKLRCSNIVAYAPSVGVPIAKHKIPKAAIEGIHRLSHISVRDEATAIFVENLTGNSKPTVLDPTLLYDFPSSPPPERITPNSYICCYHEPALSPDSISIIKQYASHHKLQIIGAGCSKKWYDRSLINISPFQWVSLLEHCALVITGTFHGTVFAIKFRKPLIACLSTSHPNRIQKISSFLNELDLSSHYVNVQSSFSTNQLQSLLNTPIDLNMLKERLSEKKRLSISFLVNSFKFNY